MSMNFALNRLAFVLIATLTVLVILSAVIPQSDFAEEQVLSWKELLGENYVVIDTLGLDRIYQTPFFFIVLALLGANLAVGNIRRFRLVYRIEKTLLKARHIGSIVFHLSLLVIMAAIILNYLYKFNGVFALTEGQTADDAPDTYFHMFRGPFHDDELDRFRVRLDTVHYDFPVENTTTGAARISLWPGSSSAPVTAVIRTNRPLKWSGFEFHYGLKNGYSPEIVLSDSASTPIFRSFVRLSAQKIGDSTKHADFVLLPGQDLRINAEVVPSEDEMDLTSIVVRVEYAHETIYSGSLNVGDTAYFDRWQLTIPRLRGWCYIDVVESPFLDLVFTGFWLALAGLTVGLIPRLIDTRRQGQ